MHEADKHVLVFADDIASSHGPLPGGETVRYHPQEFAGMTGGLQPSERVYEWVQSEEIRSGRHFRRHYDFEKPKADLSSEHRALPDHDHGSCEIYEWPGDFIQHEDGETYARIRNEEKSSERSRVTGCSNIRELAPGHTIVLADHPRDSENRKHLLLSVEYEFKENLQASEGKGSEGSIQRFAFVAQPTSLAWRPARATPKPRTHGPQSALVVGPAGEEIWTDKYGRIKVHFFWDRLDQENEHSSCWLRVSTGWAGATFGMAAVPRIGQEVIVDFFNGDPDFPFVSGRVHNADEMPPWALPDQKQLTGIRSREIGGQMSNHVVLDDTANKVQAQIKSDYASSSLSLGQIGRIEDTSGRKDDRGGGAELRTDGHAVVRAAKGMLLTTEARPNAQLHITDMGETLLRLAQGRDLHEGMSQSALEAKAHETGDQDSVAKALKEQNDAIKGSGGDPAQGQFPEFQQPHLTLASPAGIQTTTQGSTHIVSTEHNALTSGAHTSVSAGKSLLVSAKDAVRMFAWKAGVRLIAGNADVDIQALRNGIHLLGRLNIKLESERITITAKEEVHINGGGSYSRWTASGIVHGTNGLWREHAATHSLVGPDSRTPEVVNRDVSAAFDQEVIFHHLDEKSTAAARQVFRLTRDGEPAPPPDSAPVNGQATAKGGSTTSTDSTTRVQRADAPEFYKVRWLGRRRQGTNAGGSAQWP